MLYAKPLLIVFIVILLVHVSTLRQSATPHPPDRWRALARLGFGLSKLCLLALPLEWLVHLFLQAEPVAMTGKAAWIAALAHTSQLYLCISGMADILIAYAAWRGQSCGEACDAPYRQGSFIGLWRKLHLGLSRSEGGPALRELLPTMVLVAGLSALWHGGFLAVSVWFIIQMLLISLEVWRGKSLFSPLPQPLRVILTMLLFVLTNVLLVTPDLQTAAAAWWMFFNMSVPSIYGYMLEKRLTSGWLQIMLTISLLVSIGLPRLRLLLDQEIKTWRIIGCLLLPLSLLLALRDSQNAPAVIRQIAQWPVTRIFDEGNSQVHLGHGGWLFPMRELDRLTLRRDEPGAAEELIKMAQSLKASGIPMMVVAMPPKVALYPQNFFRADYTAPVMPPGHQAKLDALKAAGIEVVDPAKPLWDRLIKNQAFYQNDSHWTDDTMKVVAEMTAKQIRKLWPALHQPDTPLIQATILDRVESGDLVKTLFPLGHASFGEETAQLVSIRGLEADPSSPILLLGDDLLGVFDDPNASFGNAQGEWQRAGFMTQLATLLGRPLSAESQTNPVSKKKLVIRLIWADQL